MAEINAPASVHIRPMLDSDLAFADSLRALVGWNQTIEDWKRFLKLSSGCFIAECDGTPAGTATTLCYGRDLAWIGMLLVHPNFRGRGAGRALLQHCIQYLRGRETNCIKLDATAQGKPIYEKVGFEEEWVLTRWEHSGAQNVAVAERTGTRLYKTSDEAAIGQLDRTAFGVSRGLLLQNFFESEVPLLVIDSTNGPGGYGMLREGARALYLGPLAATSAPSGRALANSLLARAEGKPVFWDIPDENRAAVELAKSLGFRIQRQLVRMYLGTNHCPGDPQQYFGIADPAMG